MRCFSMKTWQKLKTNPHLWEQYLIRESLTDAIRGFFKAKQFHEVEVPILTGHPAAESYLDVFTTTIIDRKKNPIPAYLLTSPELPIKKLLAAGIGNCYTITKSFRNTEMGDNLHNPEFSILEWYRSHATYMDIAKDCEALFLTILKALNRDPSVFSYQKNTINLTAPWQKISVSEAFAHYADINFEDFFDNQKARKISAAKGYTVEPDNSWEQLYNQIFLNEIEPYLGKSTPVILYDFPAAVAGLAKKKTSDPRYAERFELYIGGLELGDCYTELTDWKEQKERFDDELVKISHMGKTSYVYDYDFIEALKAGIPPCSGIAVGIDRLLMLLIDTPDIKDTLLFPIEDLL